MSCLVNYGQCHLTLVLYELLKAYLFTFHVKKVNNDFIYAVVRAYKTSRQVIQILCYRAPPLTITMSHPWAHCDILTATAHIVKTFNEQID